MTDAVRQEVMARTRLLNVPSFGLSLTGAVCGVLDWFRVYSYVVTELRDSGGQFFPQPPDTGGRLFTP